MNYETLTIILVIYILGFLLSYWMLRTEVKSVGELLIGDRALCFLLSLLSWLMVIFTLGRGWAKSINPKHWDKPVKEKIEIE